MTHVTFSGSCVTELYHVLITCCYPRKHGRRSGNRFSAVTCSTLDCMSHLWHATERDHVDKGATKEALTTAAPEAGPVSKGIILYAIRSLNINGLGNK